MQMHPQDGIVHAKVIGALWNLVHSDLGRKTAVRVGAVGELARALERHAGEEAVVLPACGTLWSLVNIDIGKEAAVEVGIAHIVELALESHHGVADIQEWGQR